MRNKYNDDMFLSNWTPGVFINGFIAWLFGVTGPLLIVLNAAQLGELSHSIIVSWVFSIYVVGGLLTVILSVYYKVPIAFAFTIPGAILVGTSLMHHSFNDVLGAYIVTGVLLILISITKSTTLFMKLIPLPIMLGMVSGVLLPFGINIFTSVTESPLLNGLALATFVFLSFSRRLGRFIPPILGAIIVAFIILLSKNTIQIQDMTFTWTMPNLYLPTFNIKTISELVIPLIITVIAIQNGQGIAILDMSGFKSPIESLTIFSGVGSIINSFFGAHSASVAGPMTGILADASSGKLEHRYKAAIVMGVLWMLFGLSATSVINMIYKIPISLIQLLAGLALINVLRDSLVSTFSANFKIGALFSFMITLSDFSLFNIGSPFWGLVFGLMFSFVFDRKDFKS